MTTKKATNTTTPSRTHTRARTTAPSEHQARPHPPDQREGARQVWNGSAHTRPRSPSKNKDSHPDGLSPSHTSQFFCLSFIFLCRVLIHARASARPRRLRSHFNSQPDVRLGRHGRRPHGPANCFIPAAKKPGLKVSTGATSRRLSSRQDLSMASKQDSQRRLGCLGSSMLLLRRPQRRRPRQVSMPETSATPES